MDWDMWLGPAPWAPYNGKRSSGSYRTNGDSWRSYKDYSGGGMTDWGAHHFGGATFAIDVRDLQPEEVTYHNDDGKAYLTFRYPTAASSTTTAPTAANLDVEARRGEEGGQAGSRLRRRRVDLRRLHPLREDPGSPSRALDYTR